MLISLRPEIGADSQAAQSVQPSVRRITSCAQASFAFADLGCWSMQARQRRLRAKRFVRESRSAPSSPPNTLSAARPEPSARLTTSPLALRFASGRLAGLPFLPLRLAR